MKSQINDIRDTPQSSCNVSSRFNFTVGALAIATALVIGYIAYIYWWK